MFRAKIISLFVMVFAILLSSCAPVASYTLPPATFTSATGESTLPVGNEATPTVTPGGVIPSTPAPILYQTLYQSPALGIQFSYPSAWYRSETNSGVTLTSFDPANPPHKLEWTDQTVSMQFGYKVLITPPASFDAWVESAKQTALSNGLSIFAEERFQLLFAGQPAARLTLVSGSGGIIHQVLTDLNGRYFEINIEGNYDLAKAVLDSVQVSYEGVLNPPDSNTPAAGICGEPQGDPVNIVLGTDASGLPLAGRCVVVNPAQRIKLINQSVNPIKMRLMEYPITLLVGSELLLDRPVGQYLALGVHSLNVGPELWVKEAVVVTAPPPIVEYNNSTVGYRLNLPGNWSIDESGMTHGISKGVTFNPPNPEPFIAYLSMSLDSRTLDQIIDLYAQSVPDAVREDVVFNGYPGIKYTYTYQNNVYGIQYYIPYGGRIYLIATDRPNDSTVQSILMTIRFTVPPQPVTYDATMADNGRTFIMNIGDKLRVNLDYGYGWSTISDFNPGILVGAADGYFAFARGTTTLTMTGNPVCYSATPPCLMPSILYTITVVVQ